jgi:hypothetical protein
MIRNKVFIPNLKEIIANEWKRGCKEMKN